MQKFPSYFKVLSKNFLSLTVVSKQESNKDVSTVQPQGSFDSNSWTLVSKQSFSGFLCWMKSYHIKYLLLDNKGEKECALYS